MKSADEHPAQNWPDLLNKVPNNDFVVHKPGLHSILLCETVGFNLKNETF